MTTPAASHYSEQNRVELSTAVWHFIECLKAENISTENIHKLLDYLCTIDVPTTDNLVKFYQRQIISYLFQTSTIAPSWDNSSAHCLFGSSGTGKTSMLLKLAVYYNHCLHVETKVIFFNTFLTERVRKYCETFNLSFLQTSSISELQNFLSSSSALVLIDSSSDSTKNQQLVSYLRSKDAYPTSMHLVLSLAEKESQMEKTRQKFLPMTAKSLIFTKLDEAVTYGEIYNTSHKWNIPLSFFSTSNAMPEGFEQATAQSLIEKLWRI